MKRLLLPITALFLLIPVLLSAQTTGTLSGTVTAEDGTPLEGATIEVLGTNRGANAKAGGTYTIAGLRAGTYDVVYSYVGLIKDTVELTISVGQTTRRDVVLYESVTDVVEVIVDRLRPNADNVVQGGTISRDDILNSARTTTNGLVALDASVKTDGVNGYSIRGSRANETSLRVDGIEVSDPVSGGFGNVAAGIFPSVSPLAVQEIQVMSSGFTAEYGDVLSGVVNTVTRSGRGDRYEGIFNYRQQLAFLNGSSKPITVKVPGEERDTVLPGYKYQGSDSRLFEFGLGGPVIPGFEDLTFYITGRYNPIAYTGSLYDVYDMSEEYAAERSQIARDIWGFALEPTNIGRLPGGEIKIHNVNAKLRYDLPSGSYIEAGGEIGLTTRELGGWSSHYMVDHPVLNGDTNRSLLERDVQNVDQNQILTRFTGRYFHTLTDLSFFEVLGGYVVNKNEVGEKDETKDYGFFQAFDIYEPIDEVAIAEGNVIENRQNTAIDRYEMQQADRLLNQYIGDSITSNLRNPITGLYEGGEAPGASKNPFGLSDGNFPTHGNSRSLEIRETQTISLQGTYENNFSLDKVNAQVRAGFDFATYTLRRHSNSLPWDQNPFFDVYGFDATPYFLSKDSTGRMAAFLEQPYNPFKGALWVSSRFNYESIVFVPGVRFDFFNPNTQGRPIDRSSFERILEQLDTIENASMKFQISPRIGVNYPVTENSLFHVNFAMMFKMPDMQQLYDNAYGDALRAGQFFGNPDIESQKVIIYDIGYEALVAEDYNVNISAYYRDIYNQTGSRLVPGIPASYTTYTVQDYGNVRGLEITAERRPIDHVAASINYTLQRAVGTASDPGANGGISADAALTEFPLSYDQTHSFNATVRFFWNNDDGPTLGGLHLLENTNISMTAVYSSGLPYTRFNTKGEQVGEFNAERYPSSFDVEGQIQRSFMLRDIFGDAVGNLSAMIYVQVYNILNNTDPFNLYTTTGSPDNDGRTLDRQLGDFVATPYYAEIDPNRPETYSTQQYDSFGERFYNPYGDVNLDGVMTQQERYENYQRLVATVQSMRNNYNTPRTFAAGVRIMF